MRRLLRIARFACMLTASHALASNTQLDSASNTLIAQQDPPAAGDNPTAQDPFAAPAPRSPEVQRDDGATTAVDAPDPFASQSSTAANKAQDSRLRLQPLDLLYQGSFIPNLIEDPGKNSSTNDFFLDGTLNWAASDSANMKARVLLNGAVQDATQSDVSYHSKATGLEYFYQQRFDDQSQALTVGRKYLGWSSGFQWRPADLIDNGFTTKNLEIQDPNRYLGIDGVRYQINRSILNVDAVVSDRDKSFYDGNQYAVKLALQRSAGVSLMYARNGDYSSKYGAILDTVLPGSTTLAVEAVHIDIDRELLYDSLHFGQTLQSLTGISSFAEVYVSLNKYIDEKRRVDLEFFYDGSGYKDASREVVSAAARNANPSFQVETAAIFANQYIGRYYTYLDYAGYVDGWKLHWTPSLLVNLGDQSYIGSISVERAFLGRSSLVFALSSYHGDSGTEFGTISHGLGVSISYVLSIL